MGAGAGQFGGFINESTATMGVQMAEKYVDQQFSKYVNVSALKNLFNGMFQVYFVVKYNNST
jgi:hypothetical protein